MTFAQYGVTAYEVQYWTGSSWVTVPGGSVSGNSKVWRRFTFPAVVTSKVRVLIHGALAGRSRLVEVEAWGLSAGSTTADVQWMVSDHLGTPRMVVDKTGSLAGVLRHDYLPFGEELFAGTGGRTSTQGYGGGNYVRQKFTGYERDDETKLDYAQARYFASSLGRFSTPDEFTGGPKELFTFAAKAAANPTFYADLTNPQSLNKYSYCLNSPLRYIDPDGHKVVLSNGEAANRREAKGRILYNLAPSERKFFSVKTDKAGDSATIKLKGDVDKALSKPHTKAFEYLVETVRSEKTVRVAIGDQLEDKYGVKDDVNKVGGGGATLNAAYTKSGDTEVYLGRGGGTEDIMLEDGTTEKASRSIVAAHEVLGHARSQMFGLPDSEHTATTVENEVRNGRGLTKRRIPSP